MHQLEVYRANIMALDRYHRKPLKGLLRKLEIFQTQRLSNSQQQREPEWSALWGSKVIRHLVPGKDSGDMLAGDNAKTLAAVLAQRLSEPLGEEIRHKWEGIKRKSHCCDNPVDETDETAREEE